MLLMLANSSNTLNYGSMMMCENMITYLSRAIPNCQFVVPTRQSQLTLERLRGATEYETIHALGPNFDDKDRKDSVSERIRIRAEVVGHYRKCDAIIVLGGDDISEYYTVRSLVGILGNLTISKLLSGKVLLIGQTIGPFYSWRKTVSRRVLSLADRVSHRGPASLRYAQQELKQGDNNVLAADLAFLDLARQGEKTDIVRKCLDSAPYMTFVPSGLGDHYCKDPKTYVEVLKRIVADLAETCRQRQMRLLIMPHVWHKKDIEIARALKESIEDPAVKLVDDLLLPFEARAILAGSELNVTQRMHAAISSIQEGKPAIPVSYSVKYNDVVGEYLGLGDLIVETDKEKFGDAVEAVRAKVNAVLENSVELRAQIQTAAAKAKQDATNEMEQIIKVVAGAGK